MSTATLPPSTPPAGQQRAVAGALVRLGAVIVLTLMFALVKMLDARGVHVVESLFYRQAFALPLVVGWIVATRGLASVRTQRIGAHARRTAMGLTGMILNFGGMILLPMAEASSLFNTTPIFATILAVLFLGERPGPWRWGAVGIGFIGVLIVLRPGAAGFDATGAAVALAGAAMTAAISIQIRDLGRTEAATTTVFWFSLLSLAPLGAAMLVFGRMHDAETWGLLVLLGLVGGLGQILLTAALRLAPVSVVLPIDYTGILFAALFGWWFFATQPGPGVWIGAPIIIASGLLIAWREHRLQRASSAPVPD